jgi:hypothetical protein
VESLFGKECPRCFGRKGSLVASPGSFVLRSNSSRPWQHDPHHPFSPCSIASTQRMLGTKRMVPRPRPAMLGNAYRWLPAGARTEQREGAPHLIAGHGARYRPGWCDLIRHHAGQRWRIVCLGWCARPGSGRNAVGLCWRERGKRPKCGASPTCSPLASPRRPAISSAKRGWHSRGPREFCRAYIG